MARTTLYLCVLFLLMLSIPFVSGSISVQNLAIKPTGDLISGLNPPKQVTISYGVIFYPDGGLTFSSSDTLAMSTDLDNARWDYTEVLDGNPSTPQLVNGKTVDLSGWELSYPSRRDLSVKVNLTGDVPVVPATQKKTLIRVAEIGGNGVVPGSEVLREANIILPGSVPLTTASGSQTPVLTATQTGTTSPVPTSAASKPTSSAPAGGSFSISPEVLMLVLLLISFIPLGLLVFHDYFGLGRISYPQDLRTRAATAVVYALCGAGLLFVMSVLQSLYTSLSPQANGFAPVFTILVLLMVSYFALSAFVLAIGAIVSKAFRWTLKVHMVIGVIVLFIVPITLYTVGSPPGRDIAALIAIIAAVVSSLLALLQEHSIAHDLGKDWYTSIRDLFQRKEKRAAPQPDTHSESAAAMSILNTRLAKGEISLQEYNERKEAIKK